MRRHEWRPARVTTVESAARDMVALGIEPAEWIPHAAGQHYEIRFPGERLSRKFSIASPPERINEVEFGVQVLPKGMLSPRLAGCRPGDSLEIRGPTGAAFVWHQEDGGPLILLGGGAGITPLLAILDHYTATTAAAPLIFIHSAQSPERVFRYERYRDRMLVRFTEQHPRIDRDYLAHALEPVLRDNETRARVCGPLGFMTSMVEHLIQLGVQEARIRSEAFV